MRGWTEKPPQSREKGSRIARKRLHVGLYPRTLRTILDPFSRRLREGHEDMKKITPPTIIIDTREQTPLFFPACVPTRRATLKTGDYSIAGYESEFTVERKSLPDLVNTVIHDRERFERELERMQTYRFRRLLITAPWSRVLSGDYGFSMANGRAVMASVHAFEVRYGVPAVFVDGPQAAATRVVWWARYYVREREKEEELGKTK